MCIGLTVVERRRSWHDATAPEDVKVEVDRDHVARTQSAADRYWYRVNQRAIEQPAAVDANRLEDAWQCIRGTHRIDELAARQPVFMARADFCGDSGKARRQIFNAAVAEVLIEAVAQPLAADQSAVAGNFKVEVSKNAPWRQFAREGFDLLEVASCKTPADDCANGRACNNVWSDAGCMQCFQDADVGPPTGGAAPQSQTDFHCSHGIKPLETRNHSARPSDNVGGVFETG